MNMAVKVFIEACKANKITNQGIYRPPALRIERELFDLVANAVQHRGTQLCKDDQDWCWLDINAAQDVKSMWIYGQTIEPK